MIELKQEELVKNRGYLATIGAAYRLLAKNIRPLFKKMWPFAFAFAMAVPFFLCMLLEQAGAAFSTSRLVGLAFSFLLLLTATIALLGKMSDVLNAKGLKWNLARWGKMTGIAVVIAAVVGLLISSVSFAIVSSTARPLEQGPQNHQLDMIQQDAFFRVMETVGIGMLILVIIYLLALPYVYGCMKYAMDDKNRLRHLLFGNYVAGMRHWPYIFITMLTTAVIVLLVSAVATLPLTIVGLAYRMSVVGVSMGDEAGVPGYFNGMVYGVGILTFFVMAFVGIFEFMILYYMYGSIEAKEQDRLAVAV